MKIMVENTFSYLTGDIGPRVHEWFTVKNRDARWCDAYKAGKWDGCVHFLTKKRNRFLTGLIPAFLQDFPDTVTEDRRRRPEKWSPGSYLIKTPLRGYQEQAVGLALRFERGIFWMATNAGKTMVFSSLCKALSGCKITILSYGKSLLQQTKDTLEYEVGEKVGLLTGDTGYVPMNRIVVASINTIHRRNINLHEEVLIFDECHLSSANEFYRYGQVSNAFYRFGFSGTALLEKRTWAWGLGSYSIRDVKLMGITGPVLFRYSNKQLIADGHSAVPIVHVHNVNVFPTKTYHTAVDVAMIKNPVMIRRIKDIVKGLPKGEYVLIFVTLICQGELLSNELGIRFIHGGTDNEDRCFFDGETRLIASNIFKLGMNLPCDHLILAGGGKGDDRKGKNAVSLLQRIGRGLRKKERKNVLHIHDFSFVGNQWLFRHSKERLAAYNKEGFHVTRERE